MTSDEELVKQFRAGNASAADKLLEKYVNVVRSVAHRFFLSYDDKEDIVQEGMWGLYSAMLSFGGEAGFSAYAYACIRNRMLDALKRSGSKPVDLLPFIDGEGVDGGVSPEKELLDREELTEIRARIRDVLSPLEYRAIIMFTEGATMTEIARALGKTYKQTDNALFRAKRKLRPLFEK